MGLIDHNGSDPKPAKYSQLLNNLLDIKRGDNCLLSKVTKETSHDVFTKMGPEVVSKILTSNNFEVILRDLDIDELIKRLTTLNKDFKIVKKGIINSDFSDEESTKAFWQSYAEQIKAIYDEFNYHYANTHFVTFSVGLYPDYLDDMIDKLKIEKQKSLKRWSNFIKMVDDKRSQTGMWPLYLGAGFITAHLAEGKAINAPLFLKRCEIKIKKSNAVLVVDSDWILNDKLIYTLKRYDHFVNFDLSYDEKNFMEIINEVLKYFDIKETFNLDFFNKKFNNQKSDEIFNKELQINPGVLLGIYLPTGSYLRDLMQKIIDNNEIDDILDVAPIKTIYEDKVNDIITNEYHKLVKIQPSSYAQDKALASALHQNTIIWGPPGTGKSQVIANIIANVLYNKKTALVMSQKNAALDVLRKRMNSLSKFVFFTETDTKISKEAFYKPICEFIKTVETIREVQPRREQNLITPTQVNIIEEIRKLKNDNKYQAIIQTYKNADGDLEKARKLAHVKTKYNFARNVQDQKMFVEQTAKLSNLKKNGYIFWWKYPDKNIFEMTEALKIKQELEIDNLTEMVKPYKTIKFNEVSLLAQYPDLLTKEYIHQNDEKFIADFLALEIKKKISEVYEKDPVKRQKYKKFTAAANAGRRQPHLFIQDYLDIISDLFPIIVTNPNNIFANWDKEHFDYAIIDEASQMFLEQGLPLMYLAKIKVIAGDTQQMQPTSWFSSRDVADAEDEGDVTENAISVLDYAEDKQVHSIMLDQNYRSNSADLMTFSSKKFYNSNLEVITKKDALTTVPIEVINVNGSWENRVNKKEIEAIYHVLKENAPLYETIIVLALNKQQADLIYQNIAAKDQALLERILGDKTILVRNLENIQGDEADLVIVSVAYDKTTSISTTYVAKQGFGKNALNVAISRAKDKLIVLKSVTAETVRQANSADFQVFRDWLAFLDMTAMEQRGYSILTESPIQFGDFDSTFEEDVYNYLMGNLIFPKDRQFKITRQYPVGSKRIDLAILDEQLRFVLGIEVDGFNYHLGAGVEKYLQDQSREEFIKAKGYDITRIAEVSWYLNQKEVANNIQNKLNEIIGVQE